jgi:predicted RNA binding protein YcfA (HicA-like mRNA interferase family)
MPSSAEKLLKKARRSKAGWMPDDLLRLYKGFGFIIRPAGGSHKNVSHPKFRHLRAIVPVHPKELSKKYVSDAVKNIDTALNLEKESQTDE